MTRLHSRLLWCKVDPLDEKQLRDGIIVPAIDEEATKSPVDAKVLDDLLSLLALTSVPDADDAGWKAAASALQKAGGGDRFLKQLADRRALAKHDRTYPPPAMKATSFCNVAETPAPDGPPSAAQLLVAQPASASPAPKPAPRPAKHH
jgi:hypothetical protein